MLLPNLHKNFNGCGCSSVYLTSPWIIAIFSYDKALLTVFRKLELVPSNRVPKKNY